MNIIRIDTNLCHKKRTMIYCRKCFTIPLLSIIIEIETKIKVTCLCGIRIILLADYINELQINQEPIFCEELLSHNKNKAEEYCINCHRYLCVFCLERHKAEKVNHIYFPNRILTHIITTEKEMNHWNYLWFCYECFSLVCLECDRKHISHYRIKAFSGYVNDPLKIIDNFNYINDCYDEYLKAIYRNAVIKFKDSSLVIYKSYQKCYNRNIDIIEMILILLKNYEIISRQGFCYQAWVNLFVNANILTEHSSVITSYVDNIIHYFDNFNIIRENHILGEFTHRIRNNKNERLKFISITMKKVTSITLYNHILILGTKNGSLIIYNILSKKRINQIKNVHNDSIEGLINVRNINLVSYSSDNTVKLWLFNEKGDDLSIEFIIMFRYNSDLLSVSYDNKSTLICTVKNGTIILLSLPDFHAECYSQNNVLSSQKFITNLSRDNKTLYAFSDNYYLHFFEFGKNNNLIVKKAIKRVRISSHFSYYETREGKLFVGGNLKNKPMIYVINIQTHCIESFIDLYYCFSVNQPKENNYYQFFKEDDNNLYIQSNCTSIIRLNKKSLKVTKWYPIKNFYNQIIYTCTNTNNTLYVTLCTDELILWEDPTLE